MLDHDGVVVSQEDESEFCDRRLSRAARSLLQRQLREQVLVGDSRIPDESNDIWMLLDYWLRNARPEECPLFSSRDRLRHDEEQSIPLKPPTNLQGAYPTRTLQERRKTSSSLSWKQNRPQRWWKCGLCFKVFHSRFYMDLHLKTKHKWNEEVNDSKLVCPAKEWCQMLGDANCHIQALKDEPYYALGSGAWGADASLVQHKYAKMAHSIFCDIQILQTECRTMLDRCRVSDISFCETLTCPLQNLHSFSWSDAVPHDWHSIWHQETQYYRTGSIMGIFLCLAFSVGVYYALMVGGNTTAPNRDNRKQNSQRPDTTLLGRRVQSPSERKDE